MPASDKTDQPPLLRVNKLTIENYKGIDRLELDFPHPVLPDEPDITVIGSENGAGKTSVLEAVLLTTCLATAGSQAVETLHRHAENALSRLTKMIIRAGNEATSVSCSYSYGPHTAEGSFTAQVNGRLEAKATEGFRGNLLEYARRRLRGERGWESQAISSVINPSADPFFGCSVSYFNSYRRVRQPDTGPAESDGNQGEPDPTESSAIQMPSSAFKEAIAKALLGKSGVLSDPNPNKASRQLEKLAFLLESYANVHPTQLELVGKTIEPMVRHIDTGEEFRLDGLSSGQKELVSLLFLVWLHSQDGPKIVLIDEPELHLNAQWHRRLVRWLGELAPDNQYILATHSEEVFGAVDKRHRILLVPNGAPTHA